MSARCSEQRELNFWVAERMTDVTTGLKMLMVCVEAIQIVDASRVLTREIWREDRVNDAAMNMVDGPVTMVCLGMHME